MDGHRDTLVPSDVRSCVVSRRCKMSKWSEWRIDNECIIPSSSASSTTKNTFSSSQIHGRRGSSHIPTQVKDNKDTKKDQKGFWVDDDKKKNDDGFSTSMIRMIRTRHVERLPQGMGRPCPHLKEYKQGHEIEQIMRKDNNRNTLFSSFTNTNSGRSIDTNNKILQQHQHPYINHLDMNRESTNQNRQPNEDDVNRPSPPSTITSTRCKNR